MENLFISELNKKDIDHFTSDFGLKVRKKVDKPFKKLCNIFTNANIIKIDNDTEMSDDEYFESLDISKIPNSTYDIKKGKNNIILERYPKLANEEPYIFVCNHTCPEDIETVLNVLDRNAYLILGSIETLKYNPEMYLSWLNGMIPFDILDKEQRKQLIPKMERVLKTNSILIFPEGSHNYSPNNLVNNLFDGPVNLSLRTGRKIVVVTLIKDHENNISYIDVSNPIDLKKLEIKKENKYDNEIENEKFYVKSLSSYIRDKMATAVYYMICRHFNIIKRKDYTDIEEQLRQEKITDAFKKMKWDHDVFDAEYLVKKSQAEKEYEEVVHTISNLRFNLNTLKGTVLNNGNYVLLSMDLERKNVAEAMRKYWIKSKESVDSTDYQKKLEKRK